MNTSLTLTNSDFFKRHLDEIPKNGRGKTNLIWMFVQIHFKFRKAKQLSSISIREKLACLKNCSQGLSCVEASIEYANLIADALSEFIELPHMKSFWLKKSRQRALGIIAEWEELRDYLLVLSSPQLKDEYDRAIADLDDKEEIADITSIFARRAEATPFDDMCTLDDLKNELGLGH